MRFLWFGTWTAFTDFRLGMGQWLLKRQFRSRDGFHVVTSIGCDYFRWRCGSRHAIRVRQPWMGTPLSSRLSRSRFRRRGIRPATGGCRAPLHVCACVCRPADSGPATCSSCTSRRHSAATTGLFSPLFLRDHGWPARCWVRLQQPRIRCLRRSLKSRRDWTQEPELGTQNYCDGNHRHSTTDCESLNFSHFNRNV
jgi:hypothetical protein